MSAPRSLAGRLRRLLTDPEHLFEHLAWRARRAKVRRVESGGEVRWEYKGGSFPDALNHGNAASFVLERAKRWCSGRGIDVGASAWPFPGATPVQEEETQNAYRLDAFADGSLDYVFSSHCLEHLHRWDEALTLWIRKLRPGGILFLYVPHESMTLWEPKGPWSGAMHVWMPREGVLRPWLEGAGVDVVELEAGPDAYWSWSIVGRKRG